MRSSGYRNFALPVAGGGNANAHAASGGVIPYLRERPEKDLIRPGAVRRILSALLCCAMIWPVWVQAAPAGQSATAPAPALAQPAADQQKSAPARQTHDQPATPGLPVDIPVIYSANYGELRPNHFHAGVDIKTEGVTGKRVFSIGDGYVSRISVSPTGYGRALYILHPDGTTSVYGHLDSFSPAIEAYVKERQYAGKAFKIELYPAKDKFPVKKGELIALSGNSGGSAGPHLHFEIRNPAQVPMNPILKGTVPAGDTIPPRAVKLYWVGIDYAGPVPVHSIRRKATVTGNGAGKYTIQGGTLKVSGEGYFAVEISERKNGTYNYMAPTSIDARIDGEQYFGMHIDAIPFDMAQFSNAVALPGADASRNGVFRLAVLPNNPLRIYADTRNRGIIRLADTDRHEIEIEITDDCGNRSLLTFGIARDDTAVPAKPTPEGRQVLWSHGFTHNSEGLSVTIPAGALYESIVFRTQSSPRPGYGYSPIYSVHDPDELLQKSITVAIDASSLPVNLRGKALLGRVTPAGRRSSAGGAWRADGNSGVVSTGTTSFGRFYIAVDTVPPRIVPAFVEGENMAGRGSLTVRITDDFAGIDTYTAAIDDKWAIFEYDPKTTRLIHYFDDARWSKGATHTLRLEVTDTKGNRSVLETKYVR